MIDKDILISDLNDISEILKNNGYGGWCKSIQKAIDLLKEQEEILKHEYWRGYNNGRADERGLQDGTIMQTFSPD